MPAAPRAFPSPGHTQEPVSFDEAFLDLTGCDRVHGVRGTARGASWLDAAEGVHRGVRLGVGPALGEEFARYNLHVVPLLNRSGWSEELLMIPTRRLPTHPGEILLEEFLRPLAISQVRFARHLGIPLQRVNEIVRGKRGVTPATAWLLAQALGTTPEFWVHLQSAYDLAASRPARKLAAMRRAS